MHGRGPAALKQARAETNQDIPYEGLTANEHLLKPPVNNRQMYQPTGDFIIQVVGGPNERYDFHVDPYEEWFYQVHGNMHVNVIDNDASARSHISEGETWLLPGTPRPAPARPEPGYAVGLVIERIREEGTLERFQWYCPNCSALVHDVELQVRDLVEDLPPMLGRVPRDDAARACSHCGALRPGKEQPGHPAPPPSSTSTPTTCRTAGRTCPADAPWLRIETEQTR